MLGIALWGPGAHPTALPHPAALMQCMLWSCLSHQMLLPLRYLKLNPYTLNPEAHTCTGNNQNINSVVHLQVCLLYQLKVATNLKQSVISVSDAAADAAALQLSAFLAVSAACVYVDESFYTPLAAFIFFLCIARSSLLVHLQQCFVQASLFVSFVMSPSLFQLPSTCDCLKCCQI